MIKTFTLLCDENQLKRQIVIVFDNKKIYLYTENGTYNLFLNEFESTHNYNYIKLKENDKGFYFYIPKDSFKHKLYCGGLCTSMNSYNVSKKNRQAFKKTLKGCCTKEIKELWVD